MLKSKSFQCFTNTISQIIFLDVVYFHLPDPRSNMRCANLHWRFGNTCYWIVVS